MLSTRERESDCGESIELASEVVAHAPVVFCCVYFTDMNSTGETTFEFPDTSKAFDSVEHGRLLEKLGWYGISQHWFQNWLGDRVQIVPGAVRCVCL